MSKLGFSALFAPSDEQAMWRVQTQDDAQAFAELLARWEKPIQRLCARMLADSHKGEDMAQEAFSKVYAKRKDFRQGSKFSTFLWRVAINLCLDELRRIKRRQELFASGEDEAGDFMAQLPGPGLNPEEAQVQQEQAASVRQALGCLAEHYRSVVVLKHYEGLKFREIAEILQLPEGTVKSRMAEALTQLHQILSRPAHGPTNINKEAQLKEALVI